MTKRGGQRSSQLALVTRHSWKATPRTWRLKAVKFEPSLVVMLYEVMSFRMAQMMLIGRPIVKMFHVSRKSRRDVLLHAQDEKNLVPPKNLGSPKKKKARSLSTWPLR